MIEINDTIYSLGHKLDKEREARERAERERDGHALETTEMIRFCNTLKNHIRTLERLLGQWAEDWHDGHGPDGDLIDETSEVLDALSPADEQSLNSKDATRPTPPRSYTINKRGVREPINRKENE